MLKAAKALLSAMGMLLLILDAKACILAAREGIFLCLGSVIPSLLPFIFLSQLAVSALLGASNPLFSLIERLLRMPGGSGCIYLAGLLGGYPTGAQLVAQAAKDKSLSREQAAALLRFCSNAGPAFIFGMLAESFSHAHLLWALWAIQLLSGILVSRTRYCPRHGVRLTQGGGVSAVGALKRSLSVMAQICGWVVLFRVLLCALQRWLLFSAPTILQVILGGLLELTCGCMSLHAVENEGLRLILCAGFLSFGGVCVAMQTAGFAGELGMKNYLAGKLLMAVFSIVLALPVQYFLLPPPCRAPLPPALCLLLPLFVVLLAAIYRLCEKNSSNLLRHGVELS